MTDDNIGFYKSEKLKFHELLMTLDWTEDCLLEKHGAMLKCPIDPAHRFPVRSKHLEQCQLIKEGFSKEYLKELIQCEQEKQLLNQSNISFSASKLGDIVHRPIPIANNHLPLNIEQTTILFSSFERSLIAQTVHEEALNLGIVPLTSPFTTDDQTIQSIVANTSQQLNKLDALHDQKRRRTKYVTRAKRKNFYDIAREMIDTGMKFLEQVNYQLDLNQYSDRHDKYRKKDVKHKHRSSSKNKRRSSRSHSRKHHRHSKKRRRS